MIKLGIFFFSKSAIKYVGFYSTSNVDSEIIYKNIVTQYTDTVPRTDIAQLIFDKKIIRANLFLFFLYILYKIKPMQQH